MAESEISERPYFHSHMAAEVSLCLLLPFTYSYVIFQKWGWEPLYMCPVALYSCKINFLFISSVYSASRQNTVEAFNTL